MNEKDKNLLKAEGYSNGLINAMSEIQKDCALQIWLIDNSESMKQNDGHHLASNGKGFVNCTRWEELSKVMKSHIQLSGALRIPSSFRFMNPPTSTGYSNLPQRFDICVSSNKDGDDDDDVEMQVQNGLEILAKSQPHGLTPLNEQLQHVAEEVKQMVDNNDGPLKASGKKVAIILATDGVSTDSTQEFLIDQLKKLATPDYAPYVHIAVRLCTDEPSKVDFFNKVDKETGDTLSMDVLVDFQAEAIEICKVNPWINYCIPLQRMREMGGGFNLRQSRVLDLLDEAPLAPEDVKEMCVLLFGKEGMHMCPEPQFDWDGFVQHVTKLQEETTVQHWDPIEEEMKPWVDFTTSDHKDKLHKRKKLKHKRQLRWFTGGILGN